MNTDTKMKELKIAAIATREARMAAFHTYSAACLATDAAWDAYNTASETARKDADAAHTYEARTYGAFVDSTGD